MVRAHLEKTITDQEAMIREHLSLRERCLREARAHELEAVKLTARVEQVRELLESVPPDGDA